MDSIKLAKLNAIAWYVKDELFRCSTKPTGRLDGKPRLELFKSAHEHQSCVLCGHEYPSGSMMLRVVFGSGFAPGVCLDLAVCQRRRNDDKTDVEREQEEIVDLVILPIEVGE